MAVKRAAALLNDPKLEDKSSKSTSIRDRKREEEISASIYQTIIGIYHSLPHTSMCAGNPFGQKWRKAGV
jgi:hypothetical protein